MSEDYSMNTSQYAERIARTGKRINDFNEDVWKIDHIQAKLCWDVEDAIADGLRAIELLYRCDYSYRDFVCDNPSLYDETISSRIEELFKKWLTGTATLLNIAKDPMLSSFAITGLDELRTQYAETLDASDFDEYLLKNTDALTDAKDRAYDELLAGETDLVRT